MSRELGLWNPNSYSLLRAAMRVCRGEVGIAHLGARFAAAAGRLVSEGGLARAVSPLRGASGSGGSPF